MKTRDERGALLTELREVQGRWHGSAMPALLQSLLEIDLTIQQLRVLAMVAVSGDSTSQNLANSLGVSLATTSGILDRLEGQGMVNRAEDPSDRRVRRINTTELGQLTMQRLVAAQPRLEERSFASVSNEDLRALIGGIEVLLRVVAAGESARQEGGQR